MASFAYVSQLLLYDNDDGSQTLRHQKLRLIEETAQPIVPITPLVAARRVNSSYQYEGTSTSLRHLNLAIDGQEVKAVIPYGASDGVQQKSCIREILNRPGVLAGRYVGESENYGDTANHNF